MDRATGAAQSRGMDIQENQEPVKFDVEGVRAKALTAIAMGSAQAVSVALSMYLGMALAEIERLQSAGVETIDLRVVPEGIEAIRDAATELERLEKERVRLRAGIEAARKDLDEDRIATACAALGAL